MELVNPLRRWRILNRRDRRILLALLVGVLLVASFSAYQVFSGHALMGKTNNTSHERERSNTEIDNDYHDPEDFPTLAPEDIPEIPSVEPDPAGIDVARQFADAYYNTNAPPRVWNSNVLKYCALIVCDAIIGDGQGDVPRLNITGDPVVDVSQQGFLAVKVPTSVGKSARITLGHDGTRWTVFSNTLE